VRVVDVTNPAAAIELTGTAQTGADGFSSLTVRASGDGPRTLLAFSESTIAWPRFIEANHPSTWHDANQSHDYVIVTHPDFAASAAPLAELRRQQGHTPAIVDVNDIYDEFSFGEKTPQAIRDFLQWAKRTWRQAPRFVVLLGDATIDPRDYAGLGDADFVPTKQVPMAGTTLETASDDWFVDFDSNGLPDIPIGRLSVRTQAQAAAAVTKIVSYEQAGAQPWTKNVLLVSGQSDSTTNFGQFSSALGALAPHDYTVRQVSADTLGSSAAHQAIADRVNDGQLIVNYAGHGSVQLWGTDGALLTNTDVTASWRNASRLPFVVAMNCLNGLFNQIWDEESLAESLQRAPDGGAVAVWASSATTPASTQALVNQELFRLIFSGTYATLGEAIAAAKRVVANPDLRRSWIFFGDPAMQLNGAAAPGDGRSRWTPPTPTPAPVTTSTSANSSSRVAGPHTINVAANGDLQGAINGAAAGDTIALEAGATFVGNFVLPAKTGATYVTIRTATSDSLLPGAAARIDASHAPLLPKIQSPNGRPALATAAGAHHYRLLFLELKANAKGAGDIVALGDGSSAQQALNDVPHDLVIDRCYIHGDARLGQQRGVSLNSASTSIVNSYIADIKATDATAQAISGWNGPGPFTIVNNYLEAAGSNFALGGTDAANAGLMPADVTFRFNYLSKPVSWRSQGWRIKNLIELRNAVRVTIDGNVLEHNGTASAAGSAVLVMPRSVEGAAPWSRVEHVQFTNNSVRHMPAAINIIDPERTANDIVVRNNLFTDVSAASGGAGRFLLVSGGLDVTIDHNTVIQDGPVAVFAYGAPSIGFTFTNNIVPDNGSAISGDGATSGSATIAQYFPGAVWIGNVIAGAQAALYPTGNWYPASLKAVGFVNIARSDYRLAATSVYLGTATDGGNPGYDGDALAADVPVSVLACPAVPTIPSPAGNRVALSFPSPLLLAGAAPAGISCVGPAGSLFPVGATMVNCAATDMLARTVSCSTVVTVQGSFDTTPVSRPAPTAPIVNVTAQTPTTSVRTQLAPATTPNGAAPSGNTLTTSLGTSFEHLASSPVTAAPAEGASPYASLAAIYGTSEASAPAAAPVETIRPSVEKSDVPVSTDAGKPSDSKEPKDSKPSKVKSVELKSDVPSPQTAGATITLTAAAVGGVGPYQYQWRVLDNGEWSLPTEWAENATFAWTATKAAAELGMMVNVRSAGSADDRPEASKTIRFVIKPAAPVQTDASAEAASNQAAPEAKGHARQ
jgi:Peptidase family C25